MNHTPLCLLLLLSLAVASTLQLPSLALSGWQVLPLPDGWKIEAPPEFVNRPERGIDSQPGALLSTHDSIYLEYDIGRETSEIKECTPTWNMEFAQREILRESFREQYQIPTVHTATVDTIDGKAAIFIRPVVHGRGTVSISIIDCYSGKWIGISGKNLSTRNEQLVLTMFLTLKAR